MSNQLKKFTLPSGMRVIFRRNSANPTVSIRMRFAGGSADDPFEKTSLSGLSGSLVTKGTSSMTPGETAQAIDRLGLDLGFSANKHTCSLSARVLADMLPKGLKLICELLSDPAPPADEFERTRQRILTGIAMRLDDPAAVASDILSRLIFGEQHPYGRTLQHAATVLQTLTLEDVNAWFRKILLPGAALCTIVGDVDEGEIEKTVTRSFSGWEGDGSFELHPSEDVALPETPKQESITMPGKTQSDIALGFPGIRRDHPDYYALKAGNTALGRLSLGGRIGQRVRDVEGMAYYAYTDFSAGIGAGPYQFRAGVAPQNVERSVELALEEMSKAKQEGLSAEELDDAVRYLSGGMARQVETNGGMAGTIMTQELYGLGDDWYLKYPQIMQRLTLEQVNEALSKHLHPEQYCLAVAGPKA